MKYVIGILLAIAVVAGIISTFFINTVTAPGEVTENLPEVVACTMDAMMCPDGSYVGRTGPTCEFVCPTAPVVSADVQAHITAKADLIMLNTPLPNAVITSPLLRMTGQARGSWYFEGSFPITLVDSTGATIAQGVAKATGDWMTSEFVPFTASLAFTNPYQVGAPETTKHGKLILKKDNPSGLPENDDALEIPVRFTE